MKKIFYLILFASVLGSCDKTDNPANPSGTLVTEAENTDPITEGTEIILNDNPGESGPHGVLRAQASDLDQTGLVDVYVTFEESPDVSSFSFEMDFDENILEPVSAAANGYDTNFGKVVLNLDENADLKSLDKITVSWSSPNGADFPAAEAIDLFIAQFQVKDGAPRDKIEFTLSYDETNGFLNSQKEVLKPKIVNYSSTNNPS